MSQHNNQNATGVVMGEESVIKHLYKPPDFADINFVSLDFNIGYCTAASATKQTTV